MDEVLRLIATYGAGLGAVGAAIAFMWSVFQFFSVRARDSRDREFETFHRLIRELVEPPSIGGALYLDRQRAVIYELRFFPRYYPFSRRTLSGLREKWAVPEFVRLIEEMDITLRVIEKHEKSIRYRIRSLLRLASVELS